MTIEPGADVRIIGRYALHQEIASGGMATVHLGRLLGPAGFSRTVAIKRLHAQYAKDPEFVSMFLDEARVAARIRHPNVVSTLDVVALEGELFIVMDYVEGESLARLIKAGRKRTENVPSNIALSIITHALYGLHSAHSAKGERGEPLGIVHRDVSPQNILIDTEGIVRVVDFGVAKAVGRLQTTRDGQLKGKLSYMAPEQLRGAKVDARTDVFAASVVLWELLVGRRLFQGENEAATFGMILECKVTPPSQAGADVPSEIDAIVMQGLASEPEKRHKNALDMAEALEQATPQRQTQRMLGRWVQSLAAETLQRRADAVRELESHSAVNEMIRAPELTSRPSNPALEPAPAARPKPPSIHDDDEPTHLAESNPDARPNAAVESPSPRPSAEERSGSSQVSSIALERLKTMPPKARKRLAVLAGVAAGLAVALVAAVAVLLVGRARTPEPAANASAAPPLSAVVEIAPLPAPPPQSAEPAASAKPAPSASVEAKPAPSEKPAAPTRYPTTVRLPKKPTPKPEVKPGCNPPYTLDKDGTRIPKLECL